MGKKKKKKDKKKPNPKKEKYAKFHREKSSSMDVSMPDLSPELMKQKQDDEQKINRHLRFSRNPPTKEVNPRRMKSKRAKIKK